MINRPPVAPSTAKAKAAALKKTASPLPSTSGEADPASTLKGVLEALAGTYSRLQGKEVTEILAPDRSWEWTPALGELRAILLRDGASNVSGFINLLESVPTDSWVEFLSRFAQRTEVAPERLVGQAVLAGYSTTVSLPVQREWVPIEIYPDTGVMSETRVREHLASARSGNKKDFLQLNPAFYAGLANRLWEEARTLRRLGAPMALVFGVSAALRIPPGERVPPFVANYRSLAS